MSKSKAQKVHESHLPGIAVKVVDGDIQLALKIFKRKFKNSGKSEILLEKKTHIKDADRKREERRMRKFNARRHSRLRD